MEIVRLRLKNFLSFKTLDHTFRKAPVLVQGKNLTEIESKETNGSGKSSMLSAITFAIINSPMRKQVLDRDLITWGEDEAEIWLDIYCSVRKQTLNIHRTLRQKGSALLEITLDEVENSVQYATVNDGNNYILNWIGITPEDLKNYYLINKENFKSFVSSSNTDKLSLISRFIKADQLDECDSLIKAKNKPLEESLVEITAKINRFEGELSVYESQLAAEEERNLEEEKRLRIEAINEEIDLLVSRHESAENKIKEKRLLIKCLKEKNEKLLARLPKFEEELESLEKTDFKSMYGEIDELRGEIDKDIKKSQSEKREITTLISNFNGRINSLKAILQGVVECPNCSTKFIPTDPNFDIKTAREEITSIEKKIKNESLKFESLEERLEGFSKQLEELAEATNEIRGEEKLNYNCIQGVRYELQQIKKELNSNNLMIDSNEHEIENLEESKARYEKESEEIAKKIEQVEKEELTSAKEEIEGLITILNKKIENARKEKEQIEVEISDNIQWGLRFKEFKMSLACEQLRLIQNLANTALKEQHSELRLSIDGFKRNAKGQVKSEITVLVINGEGEYKSFWSYSGGERARIEVALIQAFQEMINGTNPYNGLNFLMIDEVLEGTDPLGLSLLLESLNEVNFPVYIISHVMNIRAGVQSLTVIKENGFSYIE